MQDISFILVWPMIVISLIILLDRWAKTPNNDALTPHNQSPSMEPPMNDADAKALAKKHFGNVDEYLGIAVTDRKTGQIRLTKEKQKSLKEKCAKAGVHYFEVKTLDDLMTIEMEFFSPDSMSRTLAMLQEHLATSEIEEG